MKKIIAATALVAALSAVPKVFAEESVECKTSQYGGAVCGIETSTEVTVTHETVEAGIADWQLWQVIGMFGGTALLATALYKLSYRWYILG